MSEYWKKLSDRRWQRKRLEILERAGFECESCGDASNEKQLHIHHTYYEKGVEPWEYPDESLKCVCKECHKHMEDLRLRMLKAVEPPEQEFVIGYAKGIKIESGECESVKLESYEEMCGACCALRIADPILRKPVERWIKENDYVLTHDLCGDILHHSLRIQQACLVGTK
jgi:hypothetical protein